MSDPIKSLTTTASVLVSKNQSGLLNNKTYKEAMSALNGETGQKLVQKHLENPQTSVSYVRRSKTTRSDGLELVSDQLLTEIPAQSEEDTVFSLYQGFSAVLPDLEQTVAPSKRITNTLNADTIRSTSNIGQLLEYKDEVNYKLDLLEIRKGLAESDIKDIDAKIEQLYRLRKRMFDRVADYEKQQTDLEKLLGVVENSLETRGHQQPEQNGDQPDSPVLLASTAPSRKHTSTLNQYYTPGSEIVRLDAHEDGVTCFAFDAPFGTLVSSSLDNTVKVWDMNRNECIGRLEGHLSSVECLEMQNNLVLTGSLDASLKLWDYTKTGEPDSLLHSFESHVDEITAISMDNTTIVSGSADKTIRHWDMNTGQCIQTIDVMWAASRSWKQAPSRMETPYIGALQCFDAALASGSGDGVVRLWDLRSGEIIRQLIGHTNAVTCLQFDEHSILTGSLDRSVRVWDLRTGTLMDSFAYENGIKSLQFDEKRVVCATGEDTVKEYDRIDQTHQDVAQSSGAVTFARFADSYCVEGRDNGSIGVWKL
ncbi:hypothetical protein OGAPHI_006675 [Ogataea philodendri]|uniref:Mitochondrial division protein 1 n=1 Tax=Ogataea philodendri TaxID=1378263 RepID=A0A9P8NVX5_9ASCO|nr:uncharacterized protein OGAPHI_006675 [Ogataea philodendri]KAH3661268.1 hypothetical protein OGAPHI_006675 [Ogataea philodendri]